MKRQNNKRAAIDWRKRQKRKSFQKGGFSGKKLWKKALLLLLLTGAMAAFFYVLLFSDYFKIKQVQVSGVQSIPSEEITGIVKGAMAERRNDYLFPDNYFVLDIERIKSALLENFKEIEDLSIAKDFPNAISVKIEEKNPSLIWCRQNCYLVNEKGVAFLPAEENDILSQGRHFIKITEEKLIAEETEEERSFLSGKDASDATGKNSLKNGAGENVGDTEEASKIDLEENAVYIPAAITTDEQVSDESFIKFAIEADNLLSSTSSLKIKYYKTKGFKTRELIAFTDANTKLYFDTLGSAEKQVRNLNYFLNENIEKDKIETLRYIYLKNEDRVFYK